MKHRRVFIVCSLLVMIALIGTVAFSANSGGSSVPATAKPVAGAACGPGGCGSASAANAPKAAATGGCGSSSGGCGSTSGGCGAPSAATGPAVQSQVKLTALQQKKLAAIDQKGNAQTVALRAKFMKKRDEVTKLISDSKSSNATISKAMHELASIQADLQLVRVFAQRDKDKVYTKDQQAQVASAGSSCGCGSSSGGCGSSTASASQKAK